MEAAQLPKVVVLTTGGTIASRPDPAGGVVAAASGKELLSAAPEIHDIAEVRVEDLFRIGGYLMSPKDMLAVARRVREFCGDATVAGIVVTHGTDTMEETAYTVDCCTAESSRSSSPAPSATPPSRTRTARATWPTPRGWPRLRRPAASER